LSITPVFDPRRPRQDRGKVHAKGPASSTAKRESGYRAPRPIRRSVERTPTGAGWSDPGPNEFTCDGTWHTGTWKIAASSEYGHGALVPGMVYVQFFWDSPDRSLARV